MHTLEQLYSGELKGIKRLQLSQGLRSFPEEIYSLSDSLEILDLSHNQLSTLPPDLYRLKKLKIAFFSHNLFREVPDVFKKCTQLYMLGFKANKIEHFAEEILPSSISWLILTDNRIEKLPKSIGQLKLLRKCALAGNQIQEIPQEISQCKNLELIRLSANKIEEMPPALLELPKLSWLAFSGNPCSPSMDLSLREVSYSDLEVEELLGEGASGEIYRAYSKSLDQEVAFKLFKGSITSDGYAKDEMNAYMSTGEHRHLIKVLARLEGEERLGLILELISKEYTSLGLPPSLDTCTRDTFEAGRMFTAEMIMDIAKAMSSVCKHLHAKGLMHGDLYTHNILINTEGMSYLGDFGAASFYNTKDDIYEKIEVRAFGCLLEDLLNLCADQDTRLYESLKEVSLKCMDMQPHRRPLFTEVYAELLSL